MTKLQPSTLLTAVVLGLVLFGSRYALEIAEFKQARELFKVQGKTQEATQIDQLL